jgi:hypothetical protein
MQITYSLEDRIIDGTAESTLPEMVNMKNTNKEKTESPRNRQNRRSDHQETPVQYTRYLPVGRAKLSAATKRLMETGDLRNPTSFPERLKPQMVRIVPLRFCRKSMDAKG